MPGRIVPCVSISTTSPHACALLYLQNKMGAAVLRPAGLVFGAGAEWPLLTKTNQFEPISGDSLLNQCVQYLFRAALTQDHVVVFRATLITVTFENQPPAGMCGQELHVGINDGLLV